MAKIEFTNPASENLPASTETIEVRVWSLCGSEAQPFYIGSGLNFQANGNIWLEILYSIEGAQIFYTRTFLHHPVLEPESIAGFERILDEITEKGEGHFGLGDMLPETSLLLNIERSSYKNFEGEDQYYLVSKLEISADTSSVFGRTAPGQRFVSIKVDLDDPQDGIRFMRDLLHEITAVQQGEHPNPASFPPGSSDWPLVAQLNRQAYAKISEDYQENYFENPALTQVFDAWLAQLPQGGHILDAGCGHGQPVIGRLLDKGYQVTGIDFSPAMLRQASQKYPQASFMNEVTSALDLQAAFDGICSFNSVLYLDPIDFFNSIYRLYQALKPGGLLFLHGFDTGPDWRGEALGYRLDQWMWSWHYNMEEAAEMLAEHGYFEVLETCVVAKDPDEEQRIAEALEKQEQAEAEYQQHLADNPGMPQIPFPDLPVERSPYGYVITARRC